LKDHYLLLLAQLLKKKLKKRGARENPDLEEDDIKSNEI
jgi:hypothetical protein